MTNRRHKSRAAARSPQSLPAAAGNPNSTPPRLYHLVIPCRDESHQRTLYDQLTRAGHPCRVITL
jgi:hypothetical protein